MILHTFSCEILDGDAIYKSLTPFIFKNLQFLMGNPKQEPSLLSPKVPSVIITIIIIRCHS